MVISGSQIAGNISGGQAAGVTTGKAIRPVSGGATSNVDKKTANSQSTDQDAATEDGAVATIGRGENKSTLTSANTASRLGAAIEKGVALSILPPGLFGNQSYNPYGNPLLAAMGLGGAKDAWDQAATANTDPSYRGPPGGSDPAPGGVIGNVDPLYKGGITPKNITVLGASDSGSNAYGSNGTIIANRISAGIAGGQSLGNILNGLNGQTINVGVDRYGVAQSQTPHLTFTGHGLSTDSFNASKNSRVTGTGIVLIGEDGSRDFHVGIENGAQKMKVAMESIGLRVVFVRNEAQYKEAILNADKEAKEAKASGGKTLLWVHGEAHGNSNRAGGGHSADDIGFISVGGGIDERNLIGHAAYAHESHKDVLFTTGACHSGAIDANQTFEYIDKMFKLQPSKKEEPKQPEEQRTSSIDQTKPQDTRTASADKPAEAKAESTTASETKLALSEQQEQERKKLLEVNIA